MDSLLDLIYTRPIEKANEWSQKFTITMMTLFNLDPVSIQKVTDAFEKKNETLLAQDTQLKSKVDILKIVFWVGLVIVGIWIGKLLFRR